MLHVGKKRKDKNIMIIDAHNHADWHGHNFDKFIANMDKFNIDKTWILSWEAPCDEYDPESIPAFPLARSLSTDTGAAGSGPVPFELGLEYKTKAPDRFILGYAPDPRRPDAHARLRSAVDIYGVRVCGELKLRMMYDNPDALRMYRWCGEKGIPVTLHFDYDTATSTGRNFPRPNWWYGGDIDVLERMLRLCPETNFLGHAPGFWCHISDDDLGLKVSYPRGPVVPGGRIERLLGMYPNLYCDMSAGSCHIALSRDPEYTRRLIMAFPDRFLYARDYFDNIHQDLIESLALPEDIRAMLYHRNAERLTSKTE
ncbi:MAG: amidohydrolase family protein [Eubacteriales bacterium]|jgi:predicted TIM-barrel fold metal-dependent hydrolase|nr:amidohydrolase family protein [Eubacteriales bacterium]